MMADRTTDRSPASDRRLDELAFLHEIAQLATLARDWDELMRSIVDGTTVAMGVEVCSFYLADHEKTRLTLAATNGLDRTQVGKVSLGWGMGITGRVAATREPIAVVDVTQDDRFSWVRGFDIEGLTAMLSVPLVWHDGVVGVLNVQTRDARRFTDDEIAFLQTIAALLAGIVEKGRLTAEVEARLAQLTALDAARAELMSVVTHELRTPLSVVRVYVDLLGEAAEAASAAGPSAAGADGGGDPTGWHDAAIEQLGRLDRLVDSILASVRGEGLTGLSRAPFDAVQAVDETVETLRLILRPRPIRWDRPAGPMIAIGDETRFRQVLEQLLDNESKYAPSGEGVSIGIWHIADELQVYVTDDGPGVPQSRTGRASSSRSSGSKGAAGAAVQGSGCSPLAGSCMRWVGGCSSSRTGSAGRASWWPYPRRPEPGQLWTPGAHSPPVAVIQSVIAVQARSRSPSLRSSSRTGRREAAASSRRTSCSRTNTDRSSYWSGLPETSSRSSRAAANVSSRRVHRTRWNPSGSSRASSQPKSSSTPRWRRWNAIVERWKRSTTHE